MLLLAKSDTLCGGDFAVAFDYEVFFVVSESQRSQVIKLVTTERYRLKSCFNLG